jgi:hypothetical protein
MDPVLDATGEVHADFCKCYNLAMKMSFHEMVRGREGYMTGTVSERLVKLFEAFAEREENRAMGRDPADEFPCEVPRERRSHRTEVRSQQNSSARCGQLSGTDGPHE